jgi:hypothetical protein
MDLMIDAEDCHVHSIVIGCKLAGTPVSSWYRPVREEKSIDAEAQLHRNLEEVAGHWIFIMTRAKLESMGLPLKESTALETARQWCLAPTRHLQLVSMDFTCGHHAGYLGACGLVGAVPAFSQSSGAHCCSLIVMQHAGLAMHNGGGAVDSDVLCH